MNRISSAINTFVVIIENTFVFLMLFTLLSGCGGASSDGGSPQGGSALVEKNELKYFGFAAIDCNFDDPNDSEVKTSYIDEVEGFTNVGQMCVSEPEQWIGERMINLNNAGIAAILDIETILFEHHDDPTTGSGTRVTLRTDATDRWANFIALNSDFLTTDYVAAIYLVDEPAWNGLTFTEFSAALQMIKNTLPNIPTMVIEAYPMVNQIMVTDELDWLGFDRYDTVDPEHNSEWLADLATLDAARTRTEQKIVIVASTQWLPYYQEAGIQPEDMEQVVTSYYNVAKSYPSVIGLFGYLWPGGMDDPNQLGARDLPSNVQASLRTMGVSIIENSYR